MLRDAVDDLILKTCDVYMYRYMHMYMKVYMYMYTIHIHMHRDAVNDRILNAPHLKKWSHTEKIDGTLNTRVQGGEDS